MPLGHPNKTNPVQLFTPFNRYDVSALALHNNPPSELKLTLNMKRRHAAVTLALIERL